MKTIKILLIVILLLTAGIVMAATETDAASKKGLIGWLSGAGLTIISGVIIWAKKNFKGVLGKVKEIIDIPLAVTTGLSKVSTEVAQASTAVESFLDIMEEFAQDENMTAKELISKFKDRKDKVIKEIKDIPAAIDEAAANIRKEIADVMVKNK